MSNVTYKYIRKNISNLLGWKTDRKIVVFESDDWGSVRTRSKRDYELMLNKGLEVDKSIFTKYDCLESNEDLERLFETLNDFKDATNRSAVFTPMCIMANPDFDKIKEADYQKYFYEPFDITCSKYPKHDKVHNLWQKGIKRRLFMPALHGREHLSVKSWMSLLKTGNKGMLVSFEHKSFGGFVYKGKEISEYLGAFHPEKKEDIKEIELIIENAAEIFEKICGYKATHFIAPNREGPIELDDKLSELGVNYLTMSKLRKYPLGDNKYKREFNWWGKENKNKQIYLMRNCHFEPSDPRVPNYANSCIAEIDNAFRWKKPAVISTHRINYMGFIDKKNGDNGIKELRYLLRNILRKWPDVEFLTSTELGEIIRRDKY